MTDIINYYEELDSFRDKNKEAKVFSVSVTTIDGKRWDSSTMPISALSQVIATIESVDAARMAFTIWNRENGALYIFPYEQRQSVKVTLL